MLVARIAEKRAELENLKQLRDLSAGMAAQMQTLEEKLSMLSDGTEGVSQRESPAPIAFCRWWLVADQSGKLWLLCFQTGIMSCKLSIWPQVG